MYGCWLGFIFMSLFINPVFSSNSSPLDLSPETELEYYFKKPAGKSAIHSMKNIDFIYVINLDERPEKFQHTIDELKPYGIIPYRFSAVNGWNLSNETLNQLGIKFGPWMTSGIMGTSYLLQDEGKPSHEVIHIPGKTYFSHCMSRGAIGIVLSHLSILQDAFDAGYETIWVMEDDIEVKRDPHLLSEMIEKLDGLVGKNGWDILFTDQDTKNQDGTYVPCSAYARRPNFTPPNPYKFQIKEDISPDFRRLGARYGAYSMIVRRSGMKKILDFFKQYNIFLPYDMEFTLPPDIAFFNVRDDIVSTQPRAISDNGAPNYKLR
jgi:GR25 family glycosyltransferase involved in LPS biosynthesis